MINKILKLKKDIWINSNECIIKEIIKYIKQKGKLREAQI